MRRSRYTVTVQRPGVGVAPIERKVVLAYSADGAAQHFTRRGYHVQRVARGDYRARRPAPVTESWSFNLPAIRTAFEAMTGQPLPAGLRIRHGRATKSQRGIFEASVISGLEVRVARNQTAAAANLTLWHELAHVAQYVRTGDLLAYVKQTREANSDGTGYANRAHEREAREWEALAETDWLLDGERR
jgi:hypothetical protein